MRGLYFRFLALYVRNIININVNIKFLFDIILSISKSHFHLYLSAGRRKNNCHVTSKFICRTYGDTWSWNIMT